MTLVEVESGVFASVSTFVDYWNEECENTHKLLQSIPEDLWHREVIPGYRTLARLAWHIIQTPGEILERVGIKIEGPSDVDPVPSDFKQILKAHETVWHSVAHEINTRWNDQMLHDVDDMYGHRWKRSRTLTALLNHLIHHRGQMTTVMRAGGAKRRQGLYGPAKEDWSQWGMQPPTV